MMPSQDEIERMNRLYGLDKPWYEAYFVWLGNVVQLDLGRSIPQNNKPVLRADRRADAGDAAALGHVADPDVPAVDSDRPVGDGPQPARFASAP